MDKEELRVRQGSANRSANDWFDSVIEAHERGARELRRMKTMYNFSVAEGEKNRDVPKLTDIMGWSMNEVQNVHRNVRFDLVASICADLGALKEVKS